MFMVFMLALLSAIPILLKLFRLIVFTLFMGILLTPPPILMFAFVTPMLLVPPLPMLFILPIVMALD